MILACGEALIDMLPEQTVSGKEAFVPYAGGAVFNTAMALGRLGAPVGLFTGLSTDFFGDLLRETLIGSGVDASHAAISDRPSTLAFVKLVDGQATYAFHDEGTAGRMVSEADLPEAEAEALFFGGISLVVEPCGTAYETLMLREFESRPCMIDPNIRPGFITDEDAYRVRIERMCSVADIVKISEEDLAWLDPDRSAEEVVRDLIDGGTRLVCVTEGARGVTGHTREGKTFVEARKVEVADTVGAGDTFNAGLLASLHAEGVLTKEGLAQLDEQTVRRALTKGALAASVTVSRAGANPPWAAELDAL